eukprot:5523863-Pyramimonas_sp.AAC.1
MAARGQVQGDVTFFIDCQGTVDCVSDPSHACSAANPRCHIWEEVHRNQPGARAVKVKAHLPYSAVTEG